MQIVYYIIGNWKKKIGIECTLPCVSSLQKTGYIHNHLVTQRLFVPLKGKLLWKNPYSNPNRSGGGCRTGIDRGDKIQCKYALIYTHKRKG